MKSIFCIYFAIPLLNFFKLKSSLFPQALLMILFTCTFDRTYKMDVSVSAGDLLQIDGTLDESVLIGDKFPPPRIREKR